MWNIVIGRLIDVYPGLTREGKSIKAPCRSNTLIVFREPFFAAYTMGGIPYIAKSTSS